MELLDEVGVLSSEELYQHFELGDGLTILFVLLGLDGGFQEVEGPLLVG